jgi:hypothetical protein
MVAPFVFWRDGAAATAAPFQARPFQARSLERRPWAPICRDILFWIQGFMLMAKKTGVAKKKAAARAKSGRDFMTAVGLRRPAAIDPVTRLPGIAPARGPLARKM